jgi:hypothetical protein
MSKTATGKVSGSTRALRKAVKRKSTQAMTILLCKFRRGKIGFS